ncbi:MAG: hypothetical protein SFW66_04655 [Gammaproteobacteria bacterium]|nr:hypothetical protein [Gammaproteobacteria bacterium]
MPYIFYASDVKPAVLLKDDISIVHNHDQEFSYHNCHFWKRAKVRQNEIKRLDECISFFEKYRDDPTQSRKIREIAAEAVEGDKTKREMLLTQRGC